MFHHYYGQFLEYCQSADLQARSIQAFDLNKDCWRNFETFAQYFYLTDI